MPDVGDPGGEEKISVAWDPPFAQWAPERVAEHAVIPRMNQPREVCNFDVALQFVKLEADFRGFFLVQIRSGVFFLIAAEVSHIYLTVYIFVYTYVYM
jgi:hypothetical protein